MSITLIIVIVTCVISFTAFSNQELMSKYQFNPYTIDRTKQWWRFITHGFLHADFMHLFVNMFVLWMFGGAVEEYFKFHFGNKAILYFLLLYIGAIFTSVIPSFEKHKNDHWYNGVGASGGVSAMLFAYVLFQPLNSICLWGVLCLPGIIWAVAYVVYSYAMGRKANDNVNHDAHLFGAIFGFGFTIILKPKLFMYFIDQLTNIFG